MRFLPTTTTSSCRSPTAGATVLRSLWQLSSAKGNPNLTTSKSILGRRSFHQAPWPLSTLRFAKPPLLLTHPMDGTIVFQRNSESCGAAQTSNRLFSSAAAISAATFEPKPPDHLTAEMAEGILDSTQFYARFGISNQRLRQLSEVPETSMTVIDKWQQMMEIYITTQLHVIAGIGYSPTQEGLTLYAQHLHRCIQSADATMKELFIEIRRDTWREIVATVFQLKVQDLPVLDIVQARNLMHKVSSKMIEPDTLLAIQSQTAKIQDTDMAVEIQKKHTVLQAILVEKVYLSGTPQSLVEEAGFGPGAVGYAKLQCALSDHEGDPLMADYAASAMMKILSAAGIDIDSIQGPGLGSQAV